MSPTYTTIQPSALLDGANRDDTEESRRIVLHEPHENQRTLPPATPGITHLSPSSPSHIQDYFASPVVNSQTPAESIFSQATLCQPGELGEFGDNADPFFGVVFGTADESSSPSFLLDEHLLERRNNPLQDQQAQQLPWSTPDNIHDAPDAAAYRPISPAQSPCLGTGTPNGDKGEGRATFPNRWSQSIAPQVLTSQPKQLSSSLDLDQAVSECAPATGDSGHFSDDGLAPSVSGMAGQSPQVTVSMWGRDDEADLTYNPELSSFVPSGSVDDSCVSYVDHDSSGSAPSRESATHRTQNPVSRHGGLSPENRPSVEVPSINESDAQRKREEKNKDVAEWLERRDTTGSLSQLDHSLAEQSRLQTSDEFDGVSKRDIPLGDKTENNYVSGQTYYIEKGKGEITAQDLDLMHQNRNWADAPVIHPILQEGPRRYQPDTSSAAMAKFESMCRDNDVMSRVATWGTRRRSEPSLTDIEGVTSGNFLKKLTLGRDRSRERRPSTILKELRERVMKQSSASKRSRSEQDDDSSGHVESAGERKESQNSLAPPGRSLSWGKKQPIPSINTAFVNIGSNAATIGATHARSGSISVTPITSPRSPGNFSRSVKRPLGRIRSKSELTKNSGGSNLVDLWKRTGGPPVASLGTHSSVAPEVEDDDDDDDMSEEPGIKTGSEQLIDDITPNFSGFQEHILRLNPELKTHNKFLVERIAHQQISRYKALLTLRVKHLQATAKKNCACGTMCIAQGGSANLIDSKGEARGPDPLSARCDASDGDVTSPLEGAINQDSFPADIPMPPASSLPAEFECQLCFQLKKYQKPSDWTKHVHEDVQPFTCTWATCREAKMFKRKADWVRHENEGHRHLEWWECDVEECHHICYRRDNFLQHLVREHKFNEPKAKTKAAIKRAVAPDPTWIKVENCHQETPHRPQNEPCSFCGKTFPTWKKLTVHLAKHMEQISLPVLRLVARKDLDADTIISPVQDLPPPPSFMAVFPNPGPATDVSIKRESQILNPSPTVPSQALMGGGLSRSVSYITPQLQQTPVFGMCPMPPPSHFAQPPYRQSPLDGTVPSQLGMHQHQNHHQLQRQQHVSDQEFANLHQFMYSGPPATTSAYSTMVAAPSVNPYMSVASEVEPFPAMTINALGLQDLPGGAHMQYGHGHGGATVVMDPLGTGTGTGMGGDARQFVPQGSVSPFASQGSASPFPYQGSVSPFAYSPHMGDGGFYGQ